jgi:hypothetical protein
MMDLASRLEKLGDLAAGRGSIVQVDDTACFLARMDSTARLLLVVLGEAGGLEGTRHEPSGALVCPTTPENAAALRRLVPWLNPVPLGHQTSAGFGDRLGLATPGHVRALRRLEGRPVAAVFAQQSVRENARTGRTPQQVVDDAIWGLVREGWNGPWGADADHLKTADDVATFAAAAYSMYTIDPGDHVDDRVTSDSPKDVEAKLADMPWGDLEDAPRDMERRYLARSFDLDGYVASFDKEVLWRAAAKYGRAVAHTCRMYRSIAQRQGDRPFELEVSVDETRTPTSVMEHLFIASELRRLGVRWVSLAPRFVGDFEKGVDYIGDLGTFEAELARHAAVARLLGPYKLSLHSGSDKFSIYPIAARLLRPGSAGSLGPMVHVKTAGTSYLEALRAIAAEEPALFSDILTFARQRYETDRATYHVSARLGEVPEPATLPEADLPGLLDQFHARQVLHVTYGSVLDRFGDRLRASLESHEEAYRRCLEEHFLRHLRPFVE